MTHQPELSSAAALLMLRNGKGNTLRSLSKELSAMQAVLTGDHKSHEEISDGLRDLALAMAKAGFEVFLTDAPSMTDAHGKVLSL